MDTTHNYRHAAVVLKSLTKTTANRFLSKLEPSFSQMIVMEMKRTRVTATNLREAIEKLKAEGIGAPARTDKSRHQSIEGGKSYRIDLAHRSESAGQEDSFGANSGLKVRPNLDFSKAGTVSFEKDPFAFLRSYDSPLLGNLFDDLRVRSAAVILSMMSFKFATDRLNLMDEDRKVRVMRAIADLEDLHPAEVIDLKFAVRLQIQQMVRNNPELKRKDTYAPVESVSEGAKNLSVANLSGRPDEKSQMSLVEQGKLIASLLKLPDSKVKLLLENIDTSYLAPALKTCPIALQKKIIKNMARKPAAILTKEILNVRIDEKHRISSSRRSIAEAIENLK